MNNAHVKRIGSVLAALSWMASCGGTTGTSTGGAGSSGSGTAGTTGTAGVSGASGISGTTGQSGTTGTAGTAGPSGTAGTTGAAGVSGASGRGGSGAAGVGGSAGTAGPGGTSGQAGTQGGGGRGGTTGGAGSGGASGTQWTCPAGPFTNPTSSTLTPTRVTAVPPADTFNNMGKAYGNIEGAVWLGNALYVSEIAGGANVPPSRILKVDAAGAVTIAIADAGSNGIAADAMGRLVTANHKSGGITAFTLPAGTPTTIVPTYDGKRFNSPNDLAIRSDGTIYFSDPDYQAPNGTKPQLKTRLYKVAPGASTATVIDENRMQPNGVTLALDESALFVAGADGIFKYPIDSTGNVGAGVRFAPQVTSADGMVMDCAGNLYAAAQANTMLMALSPAGTTIASTSLMGITNVAFGGSDHRTLYATAMGDGKVGSNPGPEGLFKIAMPLPGMPY